MCNTPFQGRTLADWTDCSQSGPAPKGAPRFLYKPTLSYTFYWICLRSAGAGPTILLSVVSVANENQSEPRGFNTLFHQNSFWNCNSVFDNVWSSFFNSSQLWIRRFEFWSCCLFQTVVSRFVLGRSSFNSCCCFNSYCHLSSDGWVRYLKCV